MAIEVPDWYRTVALVGVDITGEPVVVLLDSTGAIMAVMKGEYAGTLKNIAVDASGRVIMIPTDPADIWGNAISMGNAELAACLTPAKRFDRRGNVIWVDDFESGLGPYTTGNNGTLSGVSLTTKYTETGKFAVALTGGSDGLLNAYIQKALWQPIMSKVGFECHIQPDSSVDYAIVHFYIYDGVTSHRGSLKIDFTNGQLLYYSSGGSYTVYRTGYGFSVGVNLFYPVKLVIDVEHDTYLKSLFGKDEDDLSAKSLNTAASAVTPRLYATVFCYSKSGANGTLYVDLTVITQNEPA